MGELKRVLEGRFEKAFDSRIEGVSSGLVLCGLVWFAGCGRRGNFNHETHEKHEKGKKEKKTSAGIRAKQVSAKHCKLFRAARGLYLQRCFVCGTFVLSGGTVEL